MDSNNLTVSNPDSSNNEASDDLSSDEESFMEYDEYVRCLLCEHKTICRFEGMLQGCEELLTVYFSKNNVVYEIFSRCKNIYVCHTCNNIWFPEHSIKRSESFTVHNTESDVIDLSDNMSDLTLL